MKKATQQAIPEPAPLAGIEVNPVPVGYEITLDASTGAVRNLSPVECLALSKVLTEDAARLERKRVEPGQYEVEFAVKVHGQIAVALDTTTSTYSVGPLELLIAALNQLNGQASLPQLVANANKLAPETVAAKKAEIDAAIKAHATALHPARAGAAKATLVVEATGRQTPRVHKTRQILEAERDRKAAK